MTLYKYVKFDDLERILNGSVRFTQPGAFNDPFEMVPEFFVPQHLANRQVNLRFSVTEGFPLRHPEESQPSMNLKTTLILKIAATLIPEKY